MAHSTTQLGYALAICTERFNGWQHSTALLGPAVPLYNERQVCQQPKHRTAGFCNTDTYHTVQWPTAQHYTLLLGFAVPLYTERYNGPQPQHSTARNFITAKYRAVQWPNTQKSTDRISFISMYRKVHRNKTYNELITNGKFANSHNTALLVCPVLLCTEQYNGPQPQHNKEFLWLVVQLCIERYNGP
jgi:hypothetical protein